MKILIACEFSGIIRDAFTKYGHNVWSCDLLPTEKYGNHYQCDIFDVLYYDWDLIIAHPPCTDLANSGRAFFEKKRLNGSQQKSIEFFMKFTELECKYCIENPVGIMSTLYRKPDQIIQPYYFGHNETKRTCLWLHDLPPLVPTGFQEPRYIYRSDGKRYSISHEVGGNKENPRWKIRSRTFQGIADAMAQQWG